MCNKWPVAKLLLAEVSRVGCVAVPLWRLLQSASLCEESDSAKNSQSGLASLVPESVRRVLETESWAEFALHLDTACTLLPGSARAGVHNQQCALVERAA